MLPPHHRNTRTESETAVFGESGAVHEKNRMTQQQHEKQHNYQSNNNNNSKNKNAILAEQQQEESQQQERRHRLSAALSLRRSRPTPSCVETCSSAPVIVMPSPRMKSPTADDATGSPTASSSSIAEIAAVAAAAAAFSSTSSPDSPRAAAKDHHKTATTTVKQQKAISRPCHASHALPPAHNTVYHPLQDVHHHHHHQQQQQQEEQMPTGRLPSRTPMRGFPSEADRKRIVGCLAAVLSASLIQDELLFSSGNDGNIPLDATETTPSQQGDEDDDDQDDDDGVQDDDDDDDDDDDGLDEQHLQMRTLTPPPAAIALQTPLTTSPKRDASRSNKKKLLASSSSSSLASASSVSPEVRHKRRRHQICVELVHNAASLLFLDKSHARALEPILKIRPPRRPANSAVGEQARPVSPSSPTTVSEDQPNPDQKQQEPQQKLQEESDRRQDEEQQQHQPQQEGQQKRKHGRQLQQEEQQKEQQERQQEQQEEQRKEQQRKEEQQEKQQVEPRKFPDQQHQRAGQVISSPARHAFTPSILSPGSTSCSSSSSSGSSNGDESPARSLSPLFPETEDENDDEQSEQDASPPQTESSPTSVVPPLPSAPPSPFATHLQLIEPFLSQLSEGAGYRCISLLLLHYLLRSSNGYDARVRHAFKKLAVVVLCYERMRQLSTKTTANNLEDDDEDDETWLPFPKRETDGDDHGDQDDGRPTPISREQLVLLLDQSQVWATRKFEALECAVARKLLRLSEDGQDQHDSTGNPKSGWATPGDSTGKDKNDKESGSSLLTRDKIVRGIKIGSAGIMAGTLFAVTGGLAAPGIAAGIAAVTTGTTVAAAGTATAAVISTLSTPVAVTTMFGVGGGGLVGYKVQRRTKGVTEFEFRQHGDDSSGDKGTSGKDAGESTGGKMEQTSSQLSSSSSSSRAPELFTVVCLSGWLTDRNDFDRPWGVPITPKKKRGTSRSSRRLKTEGLSRSTIKPEGSQHNSIFTKENAQEQLTDPRQSSTEQWESLHDFHVHILKAFYGQHNPQNVARVTSILSQWKGEEDKLWILLRKKYGSDPLTDYAEFKTSQCAESSSVSHREPSFGDECPRSYYTPAKDEDDILDALLEELGYAVPEAESRSIEPLRDKANCSSNGTSARQTLPGTKEKRPSTAPLKRHRSILGGAKFLQRKPSDNTMVSSGMSKGDCAVSGASTASVNDTVNKGEECVALTTVPSDGSKKKKKDKAEEWSYHSFYAGELYTVKWESDLLIELCDSVADLAIDMVGGATTHILKQTALHTLMSAIALPYALVNAANMIDGTWTLAIERADEAGVELAKSLLESEAGHRPVTLAGFSMGARMIYACLKELARHQEIWEAERDERKTRRQKRGWGRGTSGQESNNVAYKDGRFSKTNTGGGLGDGFQAGDEGSATTEDASSYSREPAGIVEDVILMGCPNHLSLESWACCRRVVSGRLVNCFSRKDLILSLMFQYKRMSGILRPVCGTCRVEVPGVENYDVSHLVSSHSDYCGAVRNIMRLIGYGQPRPNSLPIPLAMEDG